MGRLGDLSPPRERRMARASALIGFFLADDALVQLFFHAQQLLRLFFLDAGQGTPVQRLTTSSMSSRPTMPAGRVVEVVLVAHAAQRFALLALFVQSRSGLFSNS